jgi:hypothetical protein
VKKSLAFLEVKGPQLMAEFYVDQENRSTRVIQINRDSESILAHWQMADTYMRDVMQHITTTHVNIYGQPNNAVMEGMRRLSGVGATVAVKPQLAGINRLSKS